MLRGLVWVGSSLKDLKEFPEKVRLDIGYALYFAQEGLMHPKAKPLKGFGGSVFEIVDDHRGDTYRAVYLIKTAETVYVLHAFQKKSKTGIKTPQKELDLIRLRLKRAEEIEREKRN